VVSHLVYLFKGAGRALTPEQGEHVPVRSRNQRQRRRRNLGSGSGWPIPVCQDTDRPRLAVTDQRCGHLIYAATVSDSHCVTHQNTSHTAAVANTEGISRNSRQIGFAVGFAASNTTVAFRIT